MNGARYLNLWYSSRTEPLKAKVKQILLITIVRLSYDTNVNKIYRPFLKIIFVLNLSFQTCKSDTGGNLVNAIIDQWYMLHFLFLIMEQ